MPLVAPNVNRAPVLVFSAATDTPPSGSWPASLRSVALTVDAGARVGRRGAGLVGTVVVGVGGGDAEVDTLGVELLLGTPAASCVPDGRVATITIVTRAATTNT